MEWILITDGIFIIIIIIIIIIQTPLERFCIFNINAVLEFPLHFMTFSFMIGF